MTVLKNSLCKWTLLLITLALCDPAIAQQPACLASLGTTLYRVNRDGTGGAVEIFPGQAGLIVGMTSVPPGVNVKDCSPGDVIACESASGGRIWRVDGARAGTPILQPIGNQPLGVANFTDMAFAHGKLYGLTGDAYLYQLNLSNFSQIGSAVHLYPNAGTPDTQGISFNGTDHWYVTNAASDGLIQLNDPPNSSNWVFLGDVLINFDKSDLEMYGSVLWGALHGIQGSFTIRTFNVQNGASTFVWQVASGVAANSCGFVAFTAECLDVTAQPTPQTVCPAASTSFTVTADKWSGSNLLYRWQIETTPVGSDNWSDLNDGAINGSAATASGSGTATLNITNVRFPAAGRYRCHVTNSCGGTFSNPTALTVRPDIAGNSSINVDDLLAVINTWGPCPVPCPRHCTADVAPLGGNCKVDVDDLLAVINSWGQCP